MSERLRVYLGEFKKDWDSFAKSKGRSSSGLAALILKNVLISANAKNLSFTSETGDEEDDKKTIRLYFRLKPSELAALEMVSRKDGKSKQEFIIDLLRHAFTSEPVYTAEELSAFRDQKISLDRIGRNINQIAAVFNRADPDAASGLSFELSQNLEDLKGKLNESSLQLNRIIHAARRRYRLVEQKEAVNE